MKNMKNSKKNNISITIARNVILCGLTLVAINYFSNTTSSLSSDSKSTALAEKTVSFEKSPKIAVQNTINKIVKTASESDFKALSDTKKDEVRAKLRKIIDPRFDFSEMARRSLGSNWKERTDSEKQEFVDLFSSLLATTYLNRIELIKPGMVSVDGENVREPSSAKGYATAVVSTSVKSEGEVFPINYKLVRRSTGWRVYDVIIENIGLVSNYRNEFAGIIRKKKFAGLMASLKDKVNK